MASKGYNDAVSATNWLIGFHEAGGLSKQEMNNAINAWFSAVHTMFRNQPEDFQTWASEYPEMAIRFSAKAQLSDVDIDPNMSAKEEKEYWQNFSNGIVQQMGIDTKEDGRYFITDFSGNIADDVTNEWGPGDFWKVGTMQKATDGLGNFIEENPLKAAGLIASAAAPFLGPAVGASLGLSGAAATGVGSGLLAAGGAALQGEGLSGAVTAGLTAGLSMAGMELVNQAAQGLQSAQNVSEVERVANSLKAATDGLQSAQEASKVADIANQILRVATTATYDAANQAWDVPKPDFSYEAPVGIPNPDAPPTDTVTQGDTIGNIIDRPGLLPDTGTQGSQVPTVTEDTVMAPEPGGMPEQTQQQAETDFESAGDVMANPTGEYEGIEEIMGAGSPGRWVYMGGGIWRDTVNDVRVKVPGTPSSYEVGTTAVDVTGEPVQEEGVFAGKTQSEIGGILTSLPGVVWENILKGGDAPNIGAETGGILGDTGDIVDAGTQDTGTQDTGVGTQDPTTTTTTGSEGVSTDGGVGTNQDPTTTTTTPGDGVTDTGGGQFDNVGPEVPGGNWWDNVPWELLIPLVPTDSDDPSRPDQPPIPEYDFVPTPQRPVIPMEPYEYGEVDMRPTYNVPERTMRPPPIIPAANSSQPSYEDWKEEYDRQRGLLPARPTGVLI